MTKMLNIVNVIKESPIQLLGDDGNSILLKKIQEKFSNEEQQLFVGSFYCYLYHKDDEFVINLRDVYEWCGFSRYSHATTLLKNHFKEGEHYMLNQLASAIAEARAPLHYGGQNKEDYLLTITSFKKFCMRSNTKKADEIYDYFIKMEKILHEIIHEENNHLKTAIKDMQMEIEKLSQQLRVLSQEEIFKISNPSLTKDAKVIVSVDEKTGITRYTLGFLGDWDVASEL